MNGNRCWHALLYLQGSQLKRRGSTRLDARKYSDCAKLFFKREFCLGTLVNRIKFIFGSPGKDYTTVLFQGEKWGEWYLFGGKAISFWCSLVLLSLSNCIGYKLSWSAVRFCFLMSFCHSFLKYLLNPSAVVESLNWELSKIMKMVYGIKLYILSNSFYSQFK